MSEVQQGVVLYGSDVTAVAEALRELDPRYAFVEHLAPEPGSVPVLRCSDAAEADAVRRAAPNLAWLVVELYRPGGTAEHAHDPRLTLNACKVDPVMAARAIHEHDLEVYYEVINPVRVTPMDGPPAGDDYSNLEIVVPDGHRMVAHAVRAGAPPPNCLPSDAERILPSHDLWVLTELLNTELCQACKARHS